MPCHNMLTILLMISNDVTFKQRVAMVKQQASLDRAKMIMAVAV